METGKLPASTHYACREIAEELTAAKARIAALEKALERIKHRCEAYIEADAPMQPDSSVMAINDICGAALLNKEPTND